MDAAPGHTSTPQRVVVVDVLKDDPVTIRAHEAPQESRVAPSFQAAVHLVKKLSEGEVDVTPERHVCHRRQLQPQERRERDCLEHHCHSALVQKLLRPVVVAKLETPAHESVGLSVERNPPPVAPNLTQNRQKSGTPHTEDNSMLRLRVKRNGF